MAVSYPLALPTHKNLRGITFTEIKKVGENVAPGSGVPQFYEWPWEQWQADIELGPMSRADAEPWIAWATALRGKIGTFTLGDPNGAAPRGTASGLITGVGTAGMRTITLSGSAGTLLAGDWLSVGSSRWLHKVTVNGTANGAVDIWPALRVDVSGSVAIVNARGRFRLVEPPSWSIDVAKHYRPGVIKAVEDLII